MIFSDILKIYMCCLRQEREGEGINPMEKLSSLERKTIGDIGVLGVSIFGRSRLYLFRVYLSSKIMSRKKEARKTAKNGVYCARHVSCVASQMF